MKGKTRTASQRCATNGAPYEVFVAEVSRPPHCLGAAVYAFRHPSTKWPGHACGLGIAHFGSRLAIAALLCLWPGLSAAQSLPGQSTGKWDVHAFGAVADGRRPDTAPINAAIRSCSRSGGGTVEFGPGTYLVGTIELMSNVTLDLRRGATVLGSPDLRDYRSISRTSEGRSSALITAEGQENVAIVGEGTIDGNGRSFVFQPPEPHPAGFFDAAATRQGTSFYERNQQNRDGPDRMRDRPGILALFLECRNVTLRGITVIDAPNWCIHLACSRSVELSHLTVRNSLRIPNADAIDLGACSDVRVTDCNLEAGDDGIAISPCSDGFRSAIAENILVSHCVIASRSAAVRLGWAAKDIRNVRFEHLTIVNSNRAIGIFVRGRASIENISFSDVSIQTHLVDGAWWGLGEPVHISVVPYNFKGPMGHVADVQFQGVTATSEAPIVLYGGERGGIRDVTFRGCSLSLRRSPLDRYYGGNLDLRPVTPDSQGVAKRNLAGLLAVNVNGLELKDFRIAWIGEPSAFFFAGVEADGCSAMTFEELRSPGPHRGAPSILEDGRVVEP